MTSSYLLVFWLIYIIFNDVFFSTESDIHEHIPWDVSPANGTVLIVVGNTLNTDHAEHMPTFKGQRMGDGTQTDRTFRTLLIRIIFR